MNYWYIVTSVSPRNMVTHYGLGATVAEAAGNLLAHGGALDDTVAGWEFSSTLPFAAPENMAAACGQLHMAAALITTEGAIEWRRCVRKAVPAATIRAIA